MSRQAVLQVLRFLMKQFSACKNPVTPSLSQGIRERSSSIKEMINLRQKHRQEQENNMSVSLDPMKRENPHSNLNTVNLQYS